MWYRLQWIYSCLHFRTVVSPQNNCCPGYHSSLLYCCWNRKHILISGPWQFISENSLCHTIDWRAAAVQPNVSFFNQIWNNLATLSQQKYLIYIGKDAWAWRYLLFIELKDQIPPASYNDLEKFPRKIFDAYCLNYLSFSLPILPEVTLNGYQTKSTNKNWKSLSALKV